MLLFPWQCPIRCKRTCDGAVQRDAIHREKFYFRKSVVPEDDEEEEEGKGEGEGPSVDHTHPTSHDHEFTEMTIDTIVNGKVGRGVSIAPLSFCSIPHCHGLRTSSPGSFHW